MTLFKYFARTVLIVAGVLFLMVLRDIFNPPRPIEIEIEPRFIIYPTDSVHNPDNAEFVNEVAFNEGCKPYEVTQEQFNQRYLNTK